MAKSKNSNKPKSQSNRKSTNSNIFVRTATKFSQLSKPVQIMLFAIIFAIVSGGGYAVFNSYAAINYAGLCGSGYSFKRTITMSYLGEGKDTQGGEVRVYTRDTGNNTDWCVFTVRKGAEYGKYGDTRIRVEQTDGTYERGEDTGNYRYYAGPSKVYNTNRAKIYGQLNRKTISPSTIRTPYNFYVYN